MKWLQSNVTLCMDTFHQILPLLNREDRTGVLNMVLLHAPETCKSVTAGIIPGCSLETMSTISYLSFNQVKFCIICTQTFPILALNFIIIKKTENTESNRWEWKL